MRIKVLLYNHNDTERSISDFYLSELPTTFSFIKSQQNEKYHVLQTLFNNKNDGSFYEFEQIIGKLPKKQLYEKYSTFLLKGTILESNDNLFKPVKLAVNIIYKEIIIDETQFLPHGYFREDDMLKINENDVIFIKHITISENDVFIDYPTSKFTLDSFRAAQRMPH